MTLDFYQRIMLYNLIGSMEGGTYREALVYLSILKKIKLSDKEMEESDFKQESSKISWNLPEPLYGLIDISLDKDEGQALIKAIENIQQIRVNDAIWLHAIVEGIVNGVTV